MLKMNGWKKIFYANGNQNIAEVAILISDEIHFKTMIIKKDTRTLPIDKEISKRIWHFVNMYATNFKSSNIRAPKYKRNISRPK